MGFLLVTKSCPRRYHGSGQYMLSSWAKTPSVMENHVKCISSVCTDCTLNGEHMWRLYIGFLSSRLNDYRMHSLWCCCDVRAVTARCRDLNTKIMDNRIAVSKLVTYITNLKSGCHPGNWRDYFKHSVNTPLMCIPIRRDTINSCNKNKTTTIITRIVCIRPKGRTQCIFPRSQHTCLYIYWPKVNLYQVVFGQQSVRTLFKSLAQLFLLFFF